MRHNRIQWTCSGRCGNEAQKRTWENKKAHWIDIELNGGISERQKYIDGAKRRYLNEKALVDKKLALNEKVCSNIEGVYSVAVSTPPCEGVSKSSNLFKYPRLNVRVPNRQLNKIVRERIGRVNPEYLKGLWLLV